MEPVNSRTTFETDKKEKERVRQQIYNANHKEQKQQYYIDNKVKFSEIINCECGGKFQLQNKYDHAKTKMHINFINGIAPEVKVKKPYYTDCICGISCTNLKRHQLTTYHLNYLEKVKELEQKEEEDRLQEIEDIKEQELRDNNAEVETWKAEEEENARMADIPKKKSCITIIQVSKEFKTREERVKFDLEASGTIAKYRGGNFGRFRSEGPERLDQVGFRNS